MNELREIYQGLEASSIPQPAADERCVWRQERTLHSGCGHEVDLPPATAVAWKFCPFCGRRGVGPPFQ